MIPFLVSGLLGLTSAAQPPASQPVLESSAQLVSILTEKDGGDVALRFVLNGPPLSYSAVREGTEVVVRLVGVENREGVPLPALVAPIQSAVFGVGDDLSIRLNLGEAQVFPVAERDSSSVRVILRSATDSTRGTDGESLPADDLYKVLFPGAAAGAATDLTEVSPNEPWYSDLNFIGLQVRPWVAVSYIDGRTEQLLSRSVATDTYWVIQPNLGIGISPEIGPGGGKWRANYTPRFRRQVSFDLPQLTSHFFDVNVDQPVASFGAVYGSYHHSRGVLETEEIDPGREYGIGRKFVIDTPLRPFRRNNYGFGARIDVVSDTQLDANFMLMKVRYAPGETRTTTQGFFDYDNRTFNASLRRNFGDSRTIAFGYTLHDTPTTRNRPQAEGRGHTYYGSLEGELLALTTGRIMLGYRTQKNPSAGAGGRDYKDATYGLQISREISESTTVNVGADRRLNLSNFDDNGFYVTDSLHGDLSTRLILQVFGQARVGAQRNGYRASPQVVAGASKFRRDNLRFWSVGLARSIGRWAYLRGEYTVERRDSNFDAFDIKSRAITLQIGIGAFGKAEGQTQSW